MRLVPITALILVALGIASPQQRCFAQSQPLNRAERVRAEVRAILSDPDFRVEPVRETYFSRIGKWVSERIDNFFKWLRKVFRFSTPRMGGGGNVLYWILLTALVIGMALLLAYVVSKWERQPGARARGKTPSILTEEEEAISTDPDEWLARARQLATMGDYRRAYQAAFVAMILQLDQAGAVRFDRSRTNGEYLRALRSRPNVLSLFRPLANDFDARWYGGLSISEADFARFISAHTQLKSAFQ